jgi:hypothetical protein
VNASAEGDLLQARMQRIRNRVDANAGELFEDAQRFLDWHHYLNQYPWASVGIAAGLGFWFAPRRKATRVVKLADSSIDELVRKEALHQPPASLVPQGWFMPLASMATSLLIRSASAFLIDKFLQQPTNHNRVAKPAAENRR